MGPKLDLMSQISFRNRIKSQNKKTQHSKPTPVAPKPKPEWNSLVNDLNKFKLTENEIVKSSAAKKDCLGIEKQKHCSRRIPAETGKAEKGPDRGIR